MRPTPIARRPTRTERGVVRLAIDGLANADIVLARGTAERTIANQLAAIRPSSAADLVRRSGWVDRTGDGACAGFETAARAPWLR